MKNILVFISIKKYLKKKGNPMRRGERFRIISILIYFFVFLTMFFGFFNKGLYADWLHVEKAGQEKVWVDTSYWTYKEVLVPDGHYKTVTTRQWVDDSYTVHDGHWVTRYEKVWVEDTRLLVSTEYVYIDTSHYIQKTKEVTSWNPVNFSVIEGTDRYGWDVYSFAAKYHGLKQVNYRGKVYKAHKYVIDYRPSYGGRVYAVKWVFTAKKVTTQHVYYEYVRSGYWHPVQVYKIIDNSHWEYRNEKVWIGTSYTVSQGHWEEATKQVWVDTSYYQTERILVKDGYWAEPLHGTIWIKKSPKYVFTRWHKDGEGKTCNMEIELQWELKDEQGPGSVKKIERIYIFADIKRYEGKGVQRVLILEETIDPAVSGTVLGSAYFDYSGDQESLVHIYLYASSGEQAHIYFSNPVNGFRSINLGRHHNGPADTWLGGEEYGSIHF